MLLRLEPSQVETYWPLILETIEASVPDSGLLSKETIQRNLLTGTMQAWLLCAPGQARVVRAMAVSSLIDDPVSGTRDCLIYAAEAFVPVTDAVWMQCHKDLGVFARANRCARITTFTKDKRILNLVEEMGYNTEYRFCSLDLEVSSHGSLHQSSHFNGNGRDPGEGLLRISGAGSGM